LIKLIELGSLIQLLGLISIIKLGYALSTTEIWVQPGTVTYEKRETLADDASFTIEHHSDEAGLQRIVTAFALETVLSKVAAQETTDDVARQIPESAAPRTYVAVGAPFTTSATYTVDKVTLNMSKTGSPTSVTVRIETDSSGSPSGSLAHANATDTLSAAGISSQAWHDFDYTNFSLSAGTYWIVAIVNGGSSGSDFITFYGEDLGAESHKIQNDLSEWLGMNDDFAYRVWVTDASINNQVVVGRWSSGTRDIGVRYDDGSASDADTKTTIKNVSGGSLDITARVTIL